MSDYVPRGRTAHRAQTTQSEPETSQIIVDSEEPPSSPGSPILSKREVTTCDWLMVNTCC